MNRTAIVVGLMLAASAVILTSLAGPINPPVGPIAPTAKPLSEVEPRTAINSTNTPGDADSLYRISQPGSYYLTGNVTGVAGKRGIEVAVNGVTIDLNGFSLTGVPGSLDGVYAAYFAHVVVVNGRIASWGSNGASLDSGARAHHVTFDSNGADGLWLDGNAHVVTDCISTFNTGYGIRVLVGRGTLVSGCSVTNNAGGGVRTLRSGTVRACTVTDNTGVGIDADAGTLVVENTVVDNVGDGIRVHDNCIVARNLCTNNRTALPSGAAIHVVAFSNRIEDNHCTSSYYGVWVEAVGNFIVRNTCTANTIQWTIVPGNAVGPVINAYTNPTPIPAMVGQPYPGDLGSTHPNANFSY